MIAIDIDDRMSGKAHENWEEIVKDNKYLEVVNILYTEKDQIQAKLKVMERVYGVNARAFAKVAGAAGKPLQTSGKELAGMVNELTAMQLMDQLFPVMDFIFKPELLTVNPLPAIKIGLREYYGPGEKLAEQTGAEMEECGWAHAEYLKTGEEKYLDHLCAALYRPRWLLIGPRRKHSSKLTEKLAKRIAKLDITVKRGIHFFYENCEEWWRQSFEFLYDGPKAPKGEQEPDSIDSLANSRIIRALAGVKRGTVEDIRKMTRQEIYFELAELERESKSRS